MESITHSAHIKVGTPDKCEAALAYARRGRPIFPCKPGGKEPLTKRGFKDATTDEEQIRQWWKKDPGANIGSPTGEVSDTLAVDHDLYKPETATLEELEAKLGPISHTGVTIETGSGGRQYLFKYPKDSNIRNTTGLLSGVDIRGEGGYILLPPSTTQGAYRRLDNRTLADPPGRLVGRLTEPSRIRSGGTGGTTAPICAAPDGPPILEGSRDNELTRIVGKLHDGTRPLADLEAELIAINGSRCVPPLPERQVRKIVRSIHRRKPCRRSGSPSGETLEALADIESAMWEREWRGMGGKSERDAVIALIKQGHRHSELIPSGVRVDISVREWALATAVSKRAMLDSWKNGERKPGIISRLARAGIVRADNKDRSGTNRGAYVLLLPRAEFHHSNHQSCSRTSKRASGETLRAPFSAPRLRWSAPRFDRVGDEVVRSSVLRLGKTAGAVIDALETLGGRAAVSEISRVLEVRRPRDLKRRILPRLADRGVILIAGDTVSLAEDWLEALDHDREATGEIEAARRDMRRYNLEREGYRNRHRIKADPAPTDEDLAPGREDRLKAREVDKLVAEGMARHVARAAVFHGSDPFGAAVPHADGYITELEVLPRRPDKVNGIYEHAPDCLCEWCAEDLQPRYARIREMA